MARADVTLDDFAIGAVLGQGGMATVHRAVFKPTGEEVALKLMLANVADDPTFLERFRREAKATMALRHEHICRVFAAGESDGRLFMAMEIIDGGSVRDLKIKFGRTLPQALAVEVVAQLLEALAAAHDQGVVHRDLKPANLMLTRAGKLKLVDFGIAKSTTDATLTATGMLVGTPAYMSPEQVRGDELDGRSDLFSTGIILHDLLCGRSPYFSENPGTSLVKVLQEEVPSTFDVLFGIDPVVEAVHGRLTAKEAGERVRDARTALRALAPYLERVRAKHPNLLADSIADPPTMRARLVREHAEGELQRGRRLLQKHGPVVAAALALENAIQLDKTLADAHTELAALAPQIGFHADVVTDARIHEAQKAQAHQPTNPGLMKRLADLHRASGNLREYARWTKRYLRQKEDAAALQQLTVLLWGPGADPQLVTGTVQKLRTQDIVQGVKTGGMPAIRPDVPLRERTTTALRGDAEQKAAIAAAAEAHGALRVAAADARAPRATGTTSSSSTEDVTAGADAPGWFSQLREQLGVWWWVLVGAAVVVGIIVVASRGVVAGVDVAQKGLSRHVEGEQVAEENAVFAFQRTRLNEATDALAKGSFVACSMAAQQALEGEKTAKLVLDAKWLIGQCSLLAGDGSSARDALQDFKDNANISDRRYELAKTQLRALERGEVPAGLKTW